MQRLGIPFVFKLGQVIEKFTVHEVELSATETRSCVVHPSLTLGGFTGPFLKVNFSTSFSRQSKHAYPPGFWKVFEVVFPLLKYSIKPLRRYDPIHHVFIDERIIIRKSLGILSGSFVVPCAASFEKEFLEML